MNSLYKSSLIKIEENVPLAPFTTLGVGGPARFLIRATSDEQILEALNFTRKQGHPLFILGGGSNIVVSDSGFPGVVIKVESSGIQALDEDGCEKISAASGEEWDALVRYCVDRNLAGIECLSGIPGTVGGAPIQNIGAYGEDVSEVISGIHVLDREAQCIKKLSKPDCRFEYRSSIFNSTHTNRYIVLRVDFALRAGGEPRIRYDELRIHLADKKQPPALAEVRETVLRIRGSKGMVLREEDPDSRSAGSFFKNPLLDPEKAAVIEDKARDGGLLHASERIPHFAANSGKVKIPAAWLIERAGFTKGFTCGNAGISSRHALALINRGGATTQDVINLMQMIQTKVSETFGIELLPEPVFVGF
jgi:UDP-N-acetylmuramate dehydrogenase